MALVDSKVIDKKGIVFAIRSGMARCLTTLRQRRQYEADEVLVKLDGSLKAPPSFLYQETIIKGDAKEKSIGLASILAKVTRDRHMEKLSLKYPMYGFEIHKGYGTKSHIELIKAHGLSTMHRVSFCRSFKV